MTSQDRRERAVPLMWYVVERASTPTSKVKPTVLPPPAGATCPKKRPFFYPDLGDRTDRSIPIRAPTVLPPRGGRNKPQLRDRTDPSSQTWGGLLAYCYVYLGCIAVWTLGFCTAPLVYLGCSRCLFRVLTRPDFRVLRRPTGIFRVQPVSI